MRWCYASQAKRSASSQNSNEQAGEGGVKESFQKGQFLIGALDFPRTQFSAGR